MSKPFSLQAPEAIAKEYGGNKQQIARAMQMGLVDPTAGILAGMFIDRMRGAQMQEGAASPPTIAQQVMSPPQGGPPPMGATPPQMGSVPGLEGAPPQEAGLAGLPVPETMFDPAAGAQPGFAPGGLVAFAEGGATPPNRYGFSSDLETNLGMLNRFAPMEDRYLRREQGFYEKLLSEEGRKSRKDEDKWAAIAQLGATMAQTPGTLLQAAGAGINAALPGLREGMKERRKEEREGVSTLTGREIERGKLQREQVNAALDMVEKYGGFEEALKDREFKLLLAQMDDTTRRYVSDQSAAASRYSADAGVLSAREMNPLRMQATVMGNILTQARGLAEAQVKDLPGWNQKRAEEKAAVLEQKTRQNVELFKSMYGSVSGLGDAMGFSGEGAGGMDFGPPPPGAVRLVQGGKQ